jgi:hypothetical protein
MKQFNFVLLMALALASAMLIACSSGGTVTPDGDIVCETSNDCPDGFECIAEECICTSGDCIIDGDPADIICTSDLDCPPGQLCLLDLITNNYYCAYPDTDGDTVIDGDTVDGDTVDFDTDFKCADMLIQPEILNFGAVAIQNTSTRSFNISNDSNFNVDLEIYAIKYEDIQSAEFTIDNEPTADEYPIILSRGSSIVVTVTYKPIDPGIDEVFLTIVSNACGGSITQLPMKSEYKGTAYIEVDPTDHNYLDVPIGNEVVQEFSIYNVGEADGNKVLTISEIKLAAGFDNNFEILAAGTIDYLNPKQLTPCPQEEPIPECMHTFAVLYHPQSPADVFSPHRARVLIVNNSDDPSQRVTEINVEGTATAYLLEINPVPVDFGTTVIFEHGNPEPECEADADCPEGQVCDSRSGGGQKICWKEVPVQVFNYSENPVAVKRFTFSQEEGNTSCDEYAAIDSENIISRLCSEADPCPGSMACVEYNGQNICQIPPGGADYATFTMRYAPRSVGIDTCTLHVWNTLAGEGGDRQFGVKGRGRLPNECPEAFMALQSHGPPVTRPIEGVAEGTNLCFYADVSRDPDGQLVSFEWSIDPAPGDFDITDCYFADQRHAVLCCPFDLPGDYGINLKVQDNEGCWSEQETAEVHINGNQWLQLILNFQDGGGFIGQNLVDMDLVLVDPIGGQCSDNNLTTNGSCTFPQNNGTVIMTQFSNGAGFNGTTEEMRLTYPKDGAWEIQVRYVEDCQDWYDFLIVPFCASRKRPNSYTLEAYDPKSFSTIPLWTTSGSLQEEGYQHRYRALRVNGVWTDFTKIN